MLNAAFGRPAPSAERPSQQGTTELSLPLESGLHRPSLEKSRTFPPSRMKRGAQPGEQPGSHVCPPHLCPPYGSKSVIGRRAKMEDACVAVPYLFEVPLCSLSDEVLPPRIALQLRSSATSSSAERSAATAAQLSSGVSNPLSTSSDAEPGPATAAARYAAELVLRIPGGAVETEMLHFFGVFDGHGGADAAIHCAKTLHERVREVLTALTSPPSNAAPTASGGDASASGTAQPPLPPAVSSHPLVRPHTPADHFRGAPAELHSASSGSDFLDATEIEEGSSGGLDDADAAAAAAAVSSAGHGAACTTETMEAALTKAFHLTDEEFGSMGGYEHLALVGTTAVVVLVGSRMLYLANCGDSRAVLCRGGRVVPLSVDHKPERPDETARVRASSSASSFSSSPAAGGFSSVTSFHR